MSDRPIFPWNDGIELTNGENRGIFLALGAIFELLVQIADTLDNQSDQVGESESGPRKSPFALLKAMGLNDQVGESE